jgi:hypothetical protein
MLINRIVFGLLAIVIGVVTLKYNYQIVNNTARLESIESRLGYGATYTVYKLLSMLLVLGGILYLAFGDDMFRILFSPIAGLFPKV